MTAHIVEPTRAALHGKWSSEIEPAIIVDPGDVIEYRDVLDIAWGCGQHDREQQTRAKWADRESPRDDGPALHGPVFVRGAEPGSTLVVTIEHLEPGDYGWTYLGDGPFNRDLNEAVGVAGAERLLLWRVDAQAMTATSEHGLTLPVRPFFGTIGLCPPGAGRHDGWSPTRHGGNMDLSALTAGSTIYFPVAHVGALLSLGDGHARQGDGELAGSAIECMIANARLRIALRDDFPARTVTAETPAGWVTTGFDRDLDAAIHQAVSAMLDLMTRLLDIDREHALMLASAAVDVRITQLVNGVRGAHACLSQDLIAGPWPG